MARSSHSSRETRAFFRGRVSPLLLGLIMLVVGLGILFYPLASDMLAQIEVRNALTELYSLEDSVSDDAEDDGTSSDDASASSSIGNATDAEKAANETYQKLVAYNELVRTGEAGDINDPFGFSSSDLADWGLPDGIVGQIDIPAMGVSLPLYLGATSANMRLGAAVVAGTSVPLGEEDSNCVIAAHRGYSGQAMFRDIEKLELGDLITITTPWDTLVYEVVSTQVVTPDDVEAVGVQAGRDLITLLTCHPYGYNSYRMLVFCERVDAEPQTTTLVQNLATQLTPDLSSSSSLLVAEQLLRLAGLGILLMLGIVLISQTVLGCWRRAVTRDGGSAASRSGSGSGGPGGVPPGGGGSSARGGSGGAPPGAAGSGARRSGSTRTTRGRTQSRSTGKRSDDTTSQDRSTLRAVKQRIQKQGRHGRSD